MESATREQRSHPPIRTFHPRRSRTTPAAASALARLLPTLGIPAGPDVADPAQWFEPSMPVILEIGPGMGETTLAMAAADPSHGILAVDVHTPGIGALLAGAERMALTNIRVHVGDAVPLLDSIPYGTLSGVRVYFPDPWPKVRHHKRRLVTAIFVRRVAEVLRRGGTLHLATDDADYAGGMLDAADCEPRLGNAGEGFIPRPEWRPVTKFESRAIQAGRPTWELLLRRI